MSYQEKNAWACISAIAATFIPYFSIVFREPMAFPGLFLLAVAGLVTFLVAFHVVNAISTVSIRKADDALKADESDQGIELRAAKFSGTVLATAVILWFIAAMFGARAFGIESVGGDLKSYAGTVIPISQIVLWGHILFAGLVVANIMYYAKIISGYRKLAV